jgi:hypothetical protein
MKLAAGADDHDHGTPLEVPITFTAAASSTVSH